MGYAVIFLYRRLVLVGFCLFSDLWIMCGFFSLNCFFSYIGELASHIAVLSLMMRFLNVLRSLRSQQFKVCSFFELLSSCQL